MLVTKLQYFLLAALSCAIINPAISADLKNPGDSYIFYKAGITNFEGDVETSYGSTHRTLSYDQGLGLNAGYGWITKGSVRAEAELFHRRADVTTESGSSSAGQLELNGILVSGYTSGDSPFYLGLGMGIGMASLTLNARTPSLSADNEPFLAFKISAGWDKSITESVDLFVEAEFLGTSQIDMNGSNGYDYFLNHGETSIFIGARQWF